MARSEAKDHERGSREQLVMDSSTHSALLRSLRLIRLGEEVARAPKREDHERGSREPSRMVPRRRLELPQDCSYTPLKRARLPIPPPGHAQGRL